MLQPAHPNPRGWLHLCPQVMGSYHAFNRDSPDQPVTIDARVRLLWAPGLACCWVLQGGGQWACAMHSRLETAGVQWLPRQ